MSSRLLVVLFALALAFTACNGESAGTAPDSAAESQPADSPGGQPDDGKEDKDKKDDENNKSAKNEKNKKDDDKDKANKNKNDDDKVADRKDDDKKDDDKKDDDKKDDDKDKALPEPDVAGGGEIGSVTPVRTTDPDTGGKPFVGPPSKAVIGKWDVSLDETSLPKDLDGLDQVKAATRGTMRFDDKKVEVNLLGQTRTFAFKVVKDEGNMLVLDFPDSKRGRFTLTFTDNDHVLIKEDKQNPRLLGVRAK